MQTPRRTTRVAQSLHSPSARRTTRETGAMGAEQSKEAMQQTNGAATTRASNGKLTSLTSSRPKSILKPTATQMRSLRGGPSAPRPGTFDVPESPERIRMGSRQIEGAQISPRKKGKKGAEGKTTVVEEEQVDVTDWIAKRQPLLDAQLQVDIDVEDEVRVGAEVGDGDEAQRQSVLGAAASPLEGDAEEDAADEALRKELHDEYEALQQGIPQVATPSPQKPAKRSSRNKAPSPRGIPRDIPRGMPKAARKSAPNASISRRAIVLEVQSDDTSPSSSRHNASWAAKEARAAQEPEAQPEEREEQEREKLNDGWQGGRGSMDKGQQRKEQIKQQKRETLPLGREVLAQKNSARAVAEGGATSALRKRAWKSARNQRQEAEVEEAAAASSTDEQALFVGDDDFQPENDAVDVDEQPQAEDAEEGGVAEEEQRPAQPAIQRIRGGDLWSEAAGSQIFDFSPEKTGGSTKRKTREEQAANAGPSKRQRMSPGTQTMKEHDAPVEATPEGEPGANQIRLFGLFPLLRKAYGAIRTIGVQHIDGEPQPRRKFKLRDAQVIEAMNCINDALVTLLDGSDPTADFVDVVQAIARLHRSTNEGEPDFGNEVRAVNIYAFLFPQLVRLLLHTFEHYEATDSGLEPGSPLTRRHLQHLGQLIATVVELGAGAQEYDPRPRTEYAIVQPVNNSIVAPLKVLHQKLARKLWQLENAAAARREAQHRAEIARRAATREEQEERVRVEAARLQKEWQALHWHRLNAEGDLALISAKKHRHLRIPEAYTEPEIETDATGQPFERLQVFRPRVGPPPAWVQRAEAVVWPGEHLMALQEGLRRFAGRRVYERLFRDYCGKGGVLGRYSVTEIVVCAALIRRVLEEEARREGRDAEEWVREIPIWTTGRGPGGGQENEMKS